MNRRWLLFAASALLLAGCSAGEKVAEQAVEANTPADPPAPVTPPATPPTVPAPEASAPAPTPAPDAAPDGDRDRARFDGYDALEFGMDEATFRKAWGGELEGGKPTDGGTCYHLHPAWVKVPADLAFMFEDGKFVRYSTERPLLVAPGGGKVGMTSAQIDALYPGKVERQPHKYGDGDYLRIRDGGHVLVFETDARGAAGKVTEWRVGVPPQVDYVEGCS